MSTIFQCKTCGLTAAADEMMKHLASQRHKSIFDTSTEEDIACEDCNDTNVHQLQIVRFGGDDIVLLCNGCFQKQYGESERPNTCYSLANGAILKYWEKYLRARDCCCDTCGKERDLNVNKSHSVLCDECLKKLSSTKASEYVSEKTGRFLYVLLDIKETPNKSKKGGRQRRHIRKIGRGRGKGKGKGKGRGKRKENGKGEEKTRKQKPLTILQKIDQAAFENKRENSKIESASNLTLKTFKGFKAVGSGTNLAEDFRKGAAQDVRKTTTTTTTAAAPNGVGASSRKEGDKSRSGKTKEEGHRGKAKKPDSKPEKATKSKVPVRKRDAVITSKLDSEKPESRSSTPSTKEWSVGWDDEPLPTSPLPSGKQVGKASSKLKSNPKGTKPDKSKSVPPKKQDLKLRDNKKTSRGVNSYDGNGDSSSSSSSEDDSGEETSLWNMSWDEPVKKTSRKEPQLTNSRTEGNMTTIEEGIRRSGYKQFQPQLTFSDLTEYFNTFSHAIFLEQKLENDFIRDFDILWPHDKKEIVFIVSFHDTKHNEELRKFIMPKLLDKTTNPFNERQSLILTTNDGTKVWYTFVKELKETKRRKSGHSQGHFKKGRQSARKNVKNSETQIHLLLELFPWNRLPLPTNLGSEELQLLPVSAQAQRIFFAMTRIKNPKFIELLLGQKPIKHIKFDNRLKFVNPRLNESQHRAIEHVLNNSLTVIRGPPGTGKTSTIVELIYQLIKTLHAFPILCVAASNIAVDNIAEKFIGNSDNDITVLRIVSEKKEQTYDESHPLGKVCLHNIVYRQLPREMQLLEDIRRGYSGSGGGSNFKRGQTQLSARQEKNLYLAKTKIANKVIAQAQLICTTTITSGGRHLKTIKELPVVIMDEATQSSEHTTLVPLSLPGIRNFLFVGDEHQLSSFNDIPQLELSLFERVLRNGTYGPAEHLDTQYRMHPAISAFPISEFYENNLRDGVTCRDKSWPGVKYPLFFLNCSGSSSNGGGSGYEERVYHKLGWNDGPSSPSPSSSSPSRRALTYSNKHECAAIVKILYKLVLDRGVRLSDIGVITPYSGQRDLLSEILLKDPVVNPNGTALVQEREDYDDYDYAFGFGPGLGGRGRAGDESVVNVVNGLQISTVDAFQGHERGFILFSCVRSNPDNKVGFLSDRRRLNVALTRAKYGLVVIGDKEVLRRGGGALWKNYIDFLEGKGVVFDSLDEW